MRPGDDRGRPLAGAAPTVVGDDLHSTSGQADNDRCQECGAPISAAESLRVGLGRVCRRRLVVVA